MLTIDDIYKVVDYKYTLERIKRCWGSVEDETVLTLTLDRPIKLNTASTNKNVIIFKYYYTSFIYEVIDNKIRIVEPPSRYHPEEGIFKKDKYLLYLGNFESQEDFWKLLSSLPNDIDLEVIDIIQKFL